MVNGWHRKYGPHQNNHTTELTIAYESGGYICSAYKVNCHGWATEIISQFQGFQQVPSVRKKCESVCESKCIGEYLLHHLSLTQMMSISNPTLLYDKT